jgi:23S rRNA pseudouridine1911/1915/1917 synthase
VIHELASAGTKLPGFVKHAQHAVARAEYRVPAGTPPRFLDVYAHAVGLFPSAKGARKAAVRGELTVDGRVVRHDHRVSAGEVLAVVDSARVPPRTCALDVPIAYADADVAVVHKPAGVEVSGNRLRTLVNALGGLGRSDADDALAWPWPVHRLDYGTSGLVLVARTRTAQVALGRALEERRVHKRYRALVVGRLDGDGLCDEAIDGRPAQTRWAAVAVTPAMRGGWVTTVDAWPLTGRTHQIRRHLAGLGHPVLGDAAYGVDGLILEGKGLFLAAVEVGFEHPRTGDGVWVGVREPAKFESFRLREAARCAREPTEPGRFSP